ncbi:FHA domain-containing protein [Leptolyngbya sp. FACHB-402]|nr:FHA domain-containing protein [Leptolyngbya sp. FACHB-161]MBD2377533.1 FHA domain-containing protein [Leptolyngbya sp. FACHB-238]MBD2401941.1 FHA domain-containing protein [Leptolyngbya sp. FACHB-239]MBD2408459.1 FHA domain-containing protein [Leptolyngbya sp. FACHB-402]
MSPCPACGYDENPDRTEFCVACGYDLTQISPDSSPSPPPIPQPLPIPLPTPTTPALPTAATARLIPKTVNAPVAEFVIDSVNTVIGKFDPVTGPVDIDLEGFKEDEFISRNHAEIYREGDQWKIKDLGSENGIFLRRVGESRFSARIDYPQVLSPGDEIAIAKLRFLFQSP